MVFLLFYYNLLDKSIAFLILMYIYAHIIKTQDIPKAKVVSLPLFAAESGYGMCIDLCMKNEIIDDDMLILFVGQLRPAGE